MTRLTEDGKRISNPRIDKNHQRVGKMNKWRPKTWRPEYDRIVAYSAMGKSNIWIGRQLHFTPEHVSTILGLPKAQELMSVLHAKLRENIVVNIPSVLEEIAQQAAKRVKAVMFNDELFEKSPFAVINAGMDILKGLNHLKGGGNGALPQGNTTNIGTVVITPGHRSDIMDGLDKLREIKQIHGSSTPAIAGQE